MYDKLEAIALGEEILLRQRIEALIVDSGEGFEVGLHVVLFEPISHIIILF